MWNVEYGILRTLKTLRILKTFEKKVATVPRNQFHIPHSTFHIILYLCTQIRYCDMTDTDTSAQVATSATSDGPIQLDDGPIRLDLHAIVRARLGRKARWVPRCLVSWLARLIRQDRLNALLRNNYPRRGAEFCRGVLGDLDVTVSLAEGSRLPDPARRRVIIVSNHPLGGLDGMALIDIFTRHYGGQVHFIVNDLLMAVEPLTDVFVPVDTHAVQSRSTITSIEDVLCGDDPVLIFPAGLCSRLSPDGKTITDLPWRKSFVTMARQYRRDILPVYFEGQNSPSFYRAARRRQRLGLRFNFEMVLLPREVFRAQGHHFRIACADTIPWQDIQAQSSRQVATDIRNIVYGLGQRSVPSVEDNE